MFTLFPEWLKKLHENFGPLVARVHALNVPEGDEFMTIGEHDASNFRCGNAYGVKRSDDAVLIQITVFASRTAEQKKALYRRIAQRSIGEQQDRGTRSRAHREGSLWPRSAFSSIRVG